MLGKIHCSNSLEKPRTLVPMSGKMEKVNCVFDLHGIGYFRLR